MARNIDQEIAATKTLTQTLKNAQQALSQLGTLDEKTIKHFNAIRATINQAVSKEIAIIQTFQEGELDTLGDAGDKYLDERIKFKRTERQLDEKLTELQKTYTPPVQSTKPPQQPPKEVARSKSQPYAKKAGDAQIAAATKSTLALVEIVNETNEELEKVAEILTNPQETSDNIEAALFALEQIKTKIAQINDEDKRTIDTTAEFLEGGEQEDDYINARKKLRHAVNDLDDEISSLKKYQQYNKKELASVEIESQLAQIGEDLDRLEDRSKELTKPQEITYLKTRYQRYQRTISTLKGKIANLLQHRDIKKYDYKAKVDKHSQAIQSLVDTTIGTSSKKTTTAANKQSQAPSTSQPKPK